MRQATFDLATGDLKPACGGLLDFGDGSGALCVNEKPHGDGQCIWSRSAWAERRGA